MEAELKYFEAGVNKSVVAPFTGTKCLSQSCGAGSRSYSGFGTLSKDGQIVRQAFEER
jgi:hypothetical protein